MSEPSVVESALVAVWTDRTGRHHLVSEMGNVHIRNVLSYLYRQPPSRESSIWIETFQKELMKRGAI